METPMHRNDWVFVGVRLYGLYLVVRCVLGIPVIFTAMAVADGRSIGAILLTVGFEGLMGVFLLLGAPGLSRWLEEKDAPARLPDKPVQADAAPPRH